MRLYICTRILFFRRVLSFYGGRLVVHTPQEALFALTGSRSSRQVTAAESENGCTSSFDSPSEITATARDERFETVLRAISRRGFPLFIKSKMYDKWRAEEKGGVHSMVGLISTRADKSKSISVCITEQNESQSSKSNKKYI